ncbi:dephosphocoenzyme A kinase [Carnobacterium sp. 17-4]|uniref:dephospho-CoA kinase n=1 Tax=Carnobacterium sp. (strain 17-4) TaxID=208596 RepID=UPI00020588F9|nr:dephospho-CoA kinase [Carnobacterium sp. 17-4]AEB29425.1 dephosphocoenzyme A kinase [Carnobacterium sp. 17-4]
MTVILGLTGSIATGKSTVSKIFKEQGFPVVDADVGAREVVKPGTEGLSEIKKQFGDNVILTDGTLNRAALGKIVFKDEKQREKLNMILSKRIYQWVMDQKKEYLKRDPAILVLDIPLLFEAGYEKEVDQVMVVATTKEIQIDRLMKRDKIGKEDAIQKINSQLPISEKIVLGDSVIDNSGSTENTKQQVIDWIDKITAK